MAEGPLTCGACGTPNRGGRKFCGACGEALALTCGVCGAASEPGDRFCGDCGSPLVGSPPPPTEASAAVLAGSASERRLVSVLFTDLVGFTPLSESRDAEEVRDLLSRYFEVARRIVERHGGTIEKFIGDAVMALWGSPVAHEDDAERAVRAGLDLVAAVSALGADEGIDGLAARAGVATGEASVNRAADGEGMVIGDLVNTASRVQSAAPPGGVFVTDGTRRTSDAAIAYEDAGAHELKGKAEPLRLHRALRVVAGRRGAMRTAALEAPFVGRDRELRLLRDLFHATADGGAAHLVAITGIGGIGKSRLAWEFEKYLDGLVGDVYWHRGRCIPYGEGVAYWALAEMVRSRVGAAEEEEPAVTVEKLRLWLDRWCTDVDERRWLGSQLAQLLGLGERETAQREELFTAWRRFFELLTDDGPVVLVFEDLQWADSGLLDFIDDLLDRAAERPLYVVALARPEIAERRPGWGAGRTGWTSITLAPLRDEDMDRLLRGMVPGIPDELVARVRERAEGIPLYAVETARMLLDRGVLVRTPDGVALAEGAGVADLDVPETLQALIGARLDDLPDEERSLLQHASVLGKTLSAAALAAITGLDEAALSPLLQDLVRKELLAVVRDAASPHREQYAFLQSIVQRVVYDTVSRKDRKARHLAVARYFEGSWGGEEDDVVEVVAAHYVEAYESAPGDPDAPEIRASAVTALERAGRRALSLTAWAEAAASFDRAAALSDEDVTRTRLQEQAANAVWFGGDSGDVIARMDPVIDAYEALGRPLDAARARARIAEAFWVLGRIEDALARLEDAYVALTSGEDRDVAVLDAQLGRLRYFAARDDADLERALEPIERALQIAEKRVYPGVLSDALNTKALILGSLGRPEEGLALLRRSLEIALDHDETYAALRAYTNLSHELHERDRIEDAHAYQQAGAALAERTGHRAHWWFLRGHHSQHLDWTGRWDELTDLYDDFLAHRDDPATRAGGPAIAAPWVAITAVGRGEVDRVSEQVAEFEEAVDSDDFQARAFADAVLAAVAGARGAFDEALERTGRILASHAALSVRHWIFKLAAEVALEASLAMPDLDRAETILGDLRAIPAGGRTPMVDCLLVGYGARLSAARGGGDPALIDAGFGDATMRFRDLACPFREARFALYHAEWLASIGRADEASNRAREAVPVLRDLRATPWLARAEALAGEPATAVD